VVEDGCRYCAQCVLRRIEDALTRIEGRTALLIGIEVQMATAIEEITKLTERIDALGGVVVDTFADFRALRAAMDADRNALTPDLQAALNRANTSVDGLHARLRELDVAVGEADGSDNPIGSEVVTEPVEADDASDDAGLEEEPALPIPAVGWFTPATGI
jgi:hypothetical protein